MKQCKVPNCTNSTSSRGLCPVHYALAHSLVRRKKTSWAKLEKNGKVLPTKKNRKRGRPLCSTSRWFLEK